MTDLVQITPDNRHYCYVYATKE